MKHIIVIFLILSVYTTKAQVRDSILIKRLNTELSIYSSNGIKSIRDNKKGKILLDSIADILEDDSMNCFFARTGNIIYDLNLGEELVTISNWQVFNRKCEKIVNDGIELNSIQIMSADSVLETLYQIPEHTQDKKLFIIKNLDSKYGLIDALSGLIIPFNYSNIYISDDERYFIATEIETGKALKFEREGKLMPEN